ncbi:LuxR C-terminal-related transcriptional regulator [Leptolyngbya sp. CCNP1308]|uniref:helix-turn-helix transcriptional regulator n=1 Tax=Leptolyngbya sp. CCNP1308 TaxID=3110255 RepID=UPI002B21D426|nr:LuxR C-terminal-related transcriptional regulator [Leptolyngbya sp. CCNP1308]MEA5449070.1 LuxR C-terminal-related transcriptional regulator [Leptolyngbya sp. CCNP1308]
MQSVTDGALQNLFGAIAQTQTEADLRQSVMAALGEYFAARRWMLSFANEIPAIDHTTPRLMRLALSLDYNPVLRYLVKRHTAVHDEVVLPPGVWQTLCPRADHGHVMAGPLVSEGQLVGGVAFTRHRDDGAFDADNLADLGALCLHLSTKLAALRAKQAVGLDCGALTPREAEIVELVAQGLTNKAIGAALWITENSVKQALKRIFRKLGVSSRAEMVAKLAA